MNHGLNNNPKPPLVSMGLAGSILVRLAAIALIGVVVSWFQVILVPIVFAGLLSFLIKPLIDWLTVRRVPVTPAIIISELVATLPLLGLAMIFLATAGPLSQQLPSYLQV